MMEASLSRVMRLCGLDGPSWSAWHTLAKCVDGLPLDDSERPLFEGCTGRTRPPTRPPAEVIVIKGRRAGGTRWAGANIVRASGFRTYALAPGERAIVACASPDREQSRVLFGYATAPFTSADALHEVVGRRSVWDSLRALVVRQTRWQLDLQNAVTVEVRTANYGTIRGRTYALAVADELAFWQSDDGSNPASAVLAAIRPGLASLGGQLLGISSPYAKSGPLWDAHQRYFGRDDDRVLVWRAATRVMNPTIPERVVFDALERDEASARSEWLAEFRDDVVTLVSAERLAACVVAGRREDLPPLADVDHLAVADEASGGGADSAAVAILHVEEEAGGKLVAVVDALHETRPPFDPESLVAARAELLHRYGCRIVYGDGFGKGWVEAMYRRAGIEYRALPFTKSEGYVDFLRLVNSRAVELPEHPRLLQQAAGLQRRPSATGRDLVDHRAGGHDDLVNVVAAGAVLGHRLVSAARAREPLVFW
jgi:hypothetical protein